MTQLTQHEKADLDHYITGIPESGCIDTLEAMVDILNSIFPSYPWDDGVERTAERFLNYLREYSPTKPTLAEETPPFNTTTFKLQGAGDQLVMCGPITMSSICKHHLLPFTGHVWVGYISNDNFVGLSKIPRIVKWAATRPQTQELLTTDIVKYLKHTLKPMGVMVMIKSVHTCMSCRGVRETDAEMVTSLPSGVFLSDAGARNEFLNLVTANK